MNKVNGKNNSSIALFEYIILTKSELEDRVKKLNEEIEILKFRLDEFGEVFKDSSTRQQRKQLLKILVSKATIDKSRVIDTIELQIYEDIIKYLVKEGASEEFKDPSFFHASMHNCTTLKSII